MNTRTEIDQAGEELRWRESVARFVASDDDAREAFLALAETKLRVSFESILFDAYRAVAQVGRPQ